MGWSGTRTPTVFVSSLPIQDGTSGARRAITVRPPGQNRSVAARRRASTSTIEARASRSAASIGIGLISGRPFTAKSRATAASEKGSEPMP